ncbi:MAG TPA: YicC family protein [Spirochaetota bacterium]|nr:YicC family protein [Spirochaetota bacterium]HPJ37764.1 YicC family protein [Spirochaetota bacterium]HPQ52376.1 YicC family protein [Spirochaetota bacterium]
MESMTGYGYVEGTTDQFSFSIAIKSLNSRYLEAYTNLPKILKDESIEIESLLKERFSRGKLELTIDFFEWIDSRKVNVNKELLKKYYNEFRKVETDLGMKESLSIELLLSMDGVIQRERTQLSERSRKDIFNALDAVIKKTIQMRQKEGNSTKADLKNSLSVIAKDLKEIEVLTKNSTSSMYNKLKQNIEKVAESKILDDRLYTEIAILADKLDINEEKIRLSDHIKKFKQMMNESGQIGKQLDFLAQEMFREINTISSKSNNSKISHIVVGMKNHIDKIREHCRNIV